MMEIINDRPEYGSQSRAREKQFLKAEKFKNTFFSLLTKKKYKIANTVTLTVQNPLLTFNNSSCIKEGWALTLTILVLIGTDSLGI